MSTHESPCFALDDEVTFDWHPHPERHPDMVWPVVARTPTTRTHNRWAITRRKWEQWKAPLLALGPELQGPPPSGERWNEMLEIMHREVPDDLIDRLLDILGAAVKTVNGQPVDRDWFERSIRPAAKLGALFVELDNALSVVTDYQRGKS